MQTPKSNRTILLRVTFGVALLVLLSLALAGCGSLPFGQPARPTNTPSPIPSPTTVPSATPSPTIPLPPTSTPVVVVDTPVPAPTPLPNLSAVKLGPKDLPTGFQEVAAADLKKMNLDEQVLSTGFRGIGSQARLYNLTAFSYAQKNQLVLSFLVFPMTPAEKTTFEAQLTNPDNVLKTWGSLLLGAGGLANAKPLAGVDKFGDKSIGLMTTANNAGVALREDAVIVSRGLIAQVFLSFYADGAAPPIATAELVKVLDTRLATTLGGK
jgi:hypothetical protein